MTKTKTVVKSWPALALASVFMAGTSYVLFGDIYHGHREFTTDDVLTMMALAAAACSSHWMVSAAKDRRAFLAFGHILVIAAALGLIIVKSGVRNAFSDAGFEQHIEQRNGERRSLRAQADQLKKEYDELKAAEKEECKKVGDQCRRKTARSNEALALWKDAVKAADARGPEEKSNAKMKWLAHAVASFGWIAPQNEAWFADMMTVLMPWVAVLIAEFGFVVYSSQAVGHDTETVRKVIEADRSSVSDTFVSPAPPVPPKGGPRKVRPKVAETVRKTKVSPPANVISFPQRNAIVSLLEENGHPMTCSEIGEALGLNAVQVHRTWLPVADQLSFVRQGKFKLVSLRAWDQPKLKAATA